jgi:hypothetical protein
MAAFATLDEKEMLSMKKIIVRILVAAAVAASVAGCVTSAHVPMVQVENVPVAVAPGRTLAGAITSAAMRRRWWPAVLPNGVIRCTLVQRRGKVVVDVVPHSNSAYSIRCVESNLKNNKYNQWIGNLCRSIAREAAR